MRKVWMFLSQMGAIISGLFIGDTEGGLEYIGIMGLIACLMVWNTLYEKEIRNESDTDTRGVT